ncbi:hypothetical protein CLAFUW4_10661 [Fulvia fulva]|uniref:Uncharacterized protein n=1 Tax=Passalora fulva TaxID=5499 RepID=A0A9Q8P891_PASFU|nr:uncharacterized protein CLAFUR5_05274 [Fulvia fulva]KAK4616145.1 hypothetical protein CLAFUR4_10666 [Fulvia fulva]KAK4617149.1 hypothetical protein CLAFUR0_10577 [Fulvia fulva]UJO16965.1 hypothetical protein CLAFUR5_05274 [Fulvia fulva]WPV19326.1 hypothetical protein CLAFUW4_10661 [Fulvia fulva]WPV33936.1 hypothetical protein CLAFUW7_10663 [Fulvia fulva]
MDGNHQDGEAVAKLSRKSYLGRKKAAEARVTAEIDTTRAPLFMYYIIRAGADSFLGFLRQIAARRIGSENNTDNDRNDMDNFLTYEMAVSTEGCTDEEATEIVREKVRRLYAVLANAKQTTLDPATFNYLAMIGHSAMTTQIDKADVLREVDFEEEDDNPATILGIFRQLETLAREHGVVDIACHISLVFFHVLLHLTNCINKSGVATDSCERHAQAFLERQSVDYLSYGRALQDASVAQSAIATRVLALAPELQEIVLDSLAKACCVPGMVFEQGDIAIQVQELLKRLASTRLTNSPRITMGQANVERLRKRERTSHPGYEYTNVEQLTAQLGALAEEVIVKNIAVLHPAQFPTKARPDRLPYPMELSAHTRHIRTLQLQLEMAPVGGIQYTTNIFQTQDNIGNIMSWLPALKVLKLDIDYIAQNGRFHQYVQWMARGSKGFTTFTELLEGLVNALRVVPVTNRSISYWEYGDRPWELNGQKSRCGWTVEDATRPDREQKDASALGSGEIVGSMMKELGTEFTL